MWMGHCNILKYSWWYDIQSDRQQCTCRSVAVWLAWYDCLSILWPGFDIWCQHVRWSCDQQVWFPPGTSFSFHMKPKQTQTSMPVRIICKILKADFVSKINIDKTCLAVHYSHLQTVEVLQLLRLPQNKVVAQSTEACIRTTVNLDMR